MSLELESEIHRLRLGDHACFLYDNPADDLATLVPYFKDGLSRGEQCFFVADKSEWPALLRMLSEAGVDGEGEAQRCALCHFQPTNNLTDTQVTIDTAIREGFSVTNSLRGKSLSHYVGTTCVEQGQCSPEKSSECIRSR
jgi:hypothetical protein